MKKKLIVYLLVVLTLNKSFSQNWSFVGTGPDIFYNAGKVGVGNTAPATLFDVGNTNASTLSSFGAVLGARIRTASTNTNAHRIGSLFYASQTFNNTLGYTALVGHTSSANSGSGNIGYTHGITAQTEHLATGSVTWARGFLSKGYLTNSGNLSNWAGFYSDGINRVGSLATGTITNAYGLYIAPFISSGITNKFAIYAPDSESRSEFGGPVRFTAGAGEGLILTSDASGNASWQSPAWTIFGNNFPLSSGPHYIGTINSEDLNFLVDNHTGGRIDLWKNTFFGYDAGTSSTGISSTNDNIGIGYQSLTSLTTGGSNTAIGNFTLYLSNASGNVAIGDLSQAYNTTGGANVGVGGSSLILNTEGNGNTAIGVATLSGNTEGDGNSSLGASSLQTNTEGDQNTGIGGASLYTNVTGNLNSGLGSGSDVSSATLTNATAIGANAIVNADNKVRIGDANVTMIESAIWSVTSDGRFKYNINESDVKGLEFINRLRPVVYNFDTKKFTDFLTKKMSDSVRSKKLSADFSKSTAIRQTGFIAQEVEKAANESSYDFNAIHKPDDENDNYSLAYGQFVVPLVKAVQELSKQNENLKKEIEEIKQLLKGDQLSNITGTIKISESSARLFQNTPNPFNRSTIIRYSIPPKTKKAVINITSLSGINMKEFNLNNLTQSIEISGGVLAAGTYIYSLFINDIFIDSKQMILTK